MPFWQPCSQATIALTYSPCGPQEEGKHRIEGRLTAVETVVPQDFSEADPDAVAAIGSPTAIVRSFGADTLKSFDSAIRGHKEEGEDGPKVRQMGRGSR